MGIAFDPLNNTVTLEDGTQVTFEEWAEKERVNGSWSVMTSSAAPPHTKEEKPSLLDRWQEFIYGKNEAPASDWLKKCKAEGLCPQCGKPGRVHLSAFVCDIHGVY